MSNANVISIYEDVAAGQMTSQQGAEALVSRARLAPRNPTWMPRWLYIGGVLVVALLLAPVLSSGSSDRR